MAPRVYLDTCVWLRPFDDQSQARIRRETAAFEAIAKQAVAGEVRIVGSEILEVEFDEARSRSPGADPRPLSGLATTRTRLTRSRIGMGVEMANESGLDIADALHLASAAGAADCFLTSDDEMQFNRWQKRRRQLGT